MRCLACGVGLGKTQVIKIVGKNGVRVIICKDCSNYPKMIERAFKMREKVEVRYRYYNKPLWTSDGRILYPSYISKGE